MTDRIAEIRNAFEAWMASSNYPEIADIALEKMPDGNYRSQLTHAAWQGWQGGYREASTALSERDARIAELERERDEALMLAEGPSTLRELAEGSIERGFRIVELEVALEPFAELAGGFEDKFDHVSPRADDTQELHIMIDNTFNPGTGDFTVGDLRRAASAAKGGRIAKTSDDGSIQQDVLALKIPELVASLREQLSTVRNSERERVWQEAIATIQHRTRITSRVEKNSYVEGWNNAFEYAIELLKDRASAIAEEGKASR